MGSLWITQGTSGIVVHGSLHGLDGSKANWLIVSKMDCTSAMRPTKPLLPFDPFGKTAGPGGREGVPLGRLAALAVDATGSAQVESLARGVTLGDGSITDIDRQALVVVTAAPPNVAETGRIRPLACGVISRAG